MEGTEILVNTSTHYKCASFYGVTKSYAFERPELRCRYFDLHPEMVLDPVKAAMQIENDLFNIGGDVEIGIDRDGRRWTLVAFAENLESNQKP